MISPRIIEAFGQHWNPAAEKESELISANVRDLVARLEILESERRVLRAVAANAPRREELRSADLPPELAVSESARALHAAAGRALIWPARSGRPLTSRFMARLGLVEGPKADFARRLGIVIKARFDSRCWPCSRGLPLDAAQLILSDGLWEKMAAAALKVVEVKK